MKKTVDPPLFYDILRGLKALCAIGLFGLSLQFEFLTLWYVRPFGIADLQYP